MINSKLTRAALVSAIALAFSAPTFAQSSPAGTTAATPSAAPSSAQSTGVTGGNVFTSENFKRLDKNSDGMISREEAQADPMLRDHWTKLDKANKGSVDMTAYEQYGRTLNPASATPKAADPTPKAADQKKQ